MHLHPNPKTSLFPVDTESAYCKYDAFPNDQLFKYLTSPHRPTTSSKSFLPNDKSRMHLFTAFDERSGVKSSSAISTQPNDRTANLMGLSVSDLRG